MKTKFTRPLALKDFEINKLQEARGEAQSQQIPQLWEKFRAIRNKTKKDIKKKKKSFHKSVSIKK